MSTACGFPQPIAQPEVYYLYYSDYILRISAVRFSSPTNSENAELPGSVRTVRLQY
jgi:hypothetical protein